MICVWLPGKLSEVFELDQSARDRGIRLVASRRYGRHGRSECWEGELEAFLRLAIECEDVAFGNHLDGGTGCDDGGSAWRKACRASAAEIRTAVKQSAALGAR